MSSFIVPLRLPRLEAALRDTQSESGEARWMAALALGTYTDSGDPRILQALGRLISDALEEVRAQAVESLHCHAMTGAQVDMTVLRPALHDSSARVRCAATLALASDSPQEVGAALDDSDENVRASAAAALYGVRDQALIERLSDRLDDPSFLVRFEAARTLAAAEDPRGLQTLIEAAESADDKEELALEAIGLLGDHRAAQCLRDKLKGWFVSPRVKALAAAALARCGDDSGKLRLYEQLESRRKAIRMAALSALSVLPLPGTEKGLCRILDQKDDEEASSAIVALSTLGQGRGDCEARRELESRRRTIRNSLRDELNEAIARLGEGRP